MPETNVEQTEQQQEQPSDFEPITTQEGLDRIIQKRIARERSKYADYEALQEKAAKFDASVEESKTELQKAVERAEQAEAAIAAQQLEVDRLQVIAEFNLPADLHDLVSGADADEMRERAEKLASYMKPQVNLHQVVPTDGKIPDRKPSVAGDWLRERIDRSRS